MNGVRVLIVDSEPGLSVDLRQELEGLHYRLVTCGSVASALSVLERFPADVVLSDLRMQELEGLELLRRIKNEGYAAEVILLTRSGEVASAVEAMKRGAYDYVLNPVNLDQLVVLVNKAAEKAALKREIRRLRALLRNGACSSSGQEPHTLRDAQSEHIRKTLDQVGGNRTVAARELGISRRALYYRLKQLGINRLLS